MTDNPKKPTLRELLPYKFKALAIHMSLSLVAFGIALYLILVHWYPGPLFHTSGGFQGVRIMILVDLVLGPLLTFIVFNPLKSRLEVSIDLGVIIAVQFAALAWGFYAVHSQRPIAVAYSNDAFYVTLMEDYDQQPEAEETLSALGDRYPIWVYVRKPESSAEKAGHMAFSLTEGLSEEYMAFLYAPLEAHVDAALAKTPDEARVAARPGLGKKIDQWLKAEQGKLSDYRYAFLKGRYADALLIFDRAVA